MKILLCTLVRGVLTLVVLFAFFLGLGLVMEWARQHVPILHDIIGIGSCVALVAGVFAVCYTICADKARQSREHNDG